MTYYQTDYQRYSSPQIPGKETIVKYDTLKSAVESNENVNLFGIPSRNDYPTKASHSRFPIMINCERCNDLVMTDAEYENGWACRLWGIILLPVFCTGFCLLCLNSCKDVKHVCSRCREDAGRCKSQCC